MSFLVQLPEALYAKDALNGFTQPAFNIASARAGIWLSQLAYESDQGKQDRILGQWELDRVLSFDRQFASVLPIVRTRGFIVRGRSALKNILFVIFAGTDPIVAANWATDFAFSANAEGIHHGFDAAVGAVWSEIKSALTSAAGVEVIISGHSLGGALAILCAQRVETQKCAKVAAIYTFGQPRVAGREFAAVFNPALGQRTYRLVHGHDVVPTVPPSELAFQHVGRLLQCERRGKFDSARLAPDSSGDLPTFAPTLIEGLRAGVIGLIGEEPQETRSDLLGRAFQFLPPPIRDHLPDQYWSALAPDD